MYIVGELNATSRDATVTLNRDQLVIFYLQRRMQISPQTASYANPSRLLVFTDMLTVDFENVKALCFDWLTSRERVQVLGLFPKFLSKVTSSLEHSAQYCTHTVKFITFLRPDFSPAKGTETFLRLHDEFQPCIQ